MNFPISVSSGLPSCTKTVTIKVSGQTIKLKQNHELVINGQDVTKLPYNSAGIGIRIVSSIFLQGTGNHYHFQNFVVLTFLQLSFLMVLKYGGMDLLELTLMFQPHFKAKQKFALLS